MVFSHALPPLAVRHDIENVHRRIAHQYVHKQYDDMVRLTTARYAPDFVDVRPGRPSTDLLAFSTMRDEELRNLQKGVSDGPLRWKTRLDGWRIKGDFLTLIAHHEVDGEWLKNGRRLTVHFTNAVREIWTKRSGEWKALRFQELWLKGTIDGKPFPSKA